jgi:long-chain fatty acid transport protein
MRDYSRVLGLLAFALGATHTIDCKSVGFALAEQSVVGMGYGFSGVSANPEDSSTVFFNPAGMTYLQRPEAAIALHALQISSSFSNEGSRSPAGPLVPLSGGNGGNPIGLNWVPNAYFAFKSDVGLAYGIGINAPFGLKTKYPNDWLGRYQAIDSELAALNINPSVAYSMGASSIGIGLDAQHLSAKLSNALDFGSACFGSAFGPANCSAAGILPTMKDGYVSIKGDSWGYGANVGWMLPLGGGSFIGASYRTAIKHKLSGDASFSLPALPAAFSALTAGIGNTDAKSDITLPSNASVSFRYQATPVWSVLGDMTWTGWSKLAEVRVQFANGTPDAVIPAHWKNVIRTAAGVGYALNDATTLRAGVSHEPSTIPDSFRNARVPDNDQNFVGGGLGWRLSSAHVLDFAYGHVFVKTAAVQNTVAGAGTLTGRYHTHADIFSLQYRFVF